MPAVSAFSGLSKRVTNPLTRVVALTATDRPLVEVTVRIGEVAAAANLSTKTLRYYEEQGLLPRPAREANGYRDYEDDTVKRLEFIRRGRAAGLNLGSIREILQLRDAGEAPCDHVGLLLTRELHALDQQIAELIALRGIVAKLRERATTGSASECDPDRICSYL